MLPLSTRHGPADPTEATTRTVHEHEIDGGPISIAGITDSGRWLRARMESAPVRVLTAALALVGKSVLVLATVVCLLSIGGAMLFAFPVLVPLHWLAARNSGPVGAGGWAVLAGLSLFEAGWMLSYAATGTEVPSAVAGIALGTGGAVLLLWARADRFARASLA
jgi:hypothetical protein